MFVLVRHAHAGDKRRWAGPDRQRPLSRRGHAEALGLAEVLAELGVTRLLSSPALRCLQTLAPLSDRLGIPVEPLAALDVGAPATDLLHLLRTPGVDGAALCTHGENLTGLSEEWTATGEVGVAAGASVSGMAGTPKGASWVVEGYPAPGASARHVPAPPVDDV